MTIEVDEKRFLTLRNALWAIGVIVVVGFIIGAVLFNRSQNAINAVSSQVQALEKQVSRVENALHVLAVDTPVVLIGGSLRLKQHSTSGTTTWTPLGDGRNGYSTSGTGPIATIVIKNNSDQNDEGDPSTDRLQVSIPGNTAWKVDLYTDKPAPNTPKVTISPEANLSVIDMVLDNSQIGILCPDPTTSRANPKEVDYNENGKCPSQPGPDLATSFTSMTVTVGNNVVGSLNCFDAVATPGSVTPPNHCKVVFRTK